MRWTAGQRSGNLEDRRGQGGRGGGMFIPSGGGGRLGCGGIVLLFILSVVFKEDFFSLLGGAGGVATTSQQEPAGSSGPVASSPDEEKMVDFVSFVLDDAQGTWQRLLPGYRDAKLVLFRDAVRSACGFAEAATGPFYCPGDEKVYIDLAFYDELDRRFGAPGDFAQAYVLAHEIGHHVQTVMGLEREVRAAQQGRPDSANDLSILMELQADCFAGVWAHATAQKQLLEEGDLEEGLNAAAAVGDDRIQKRATGYVNPESFTHGTAKQRAQWFATGFKTGDPNACDTFGR
jgi:predicted metalloprotease